MNQDIVKILELMSELEFRVSELHSECARQFAANQQFWSCLSKTEIAHGEAIKQMIKLYTDKPAEFRVSRPFTAISINATITWIKDRLGHLRSGLLPENKMLFVARDLEASLLESKFTEYLSTGNTEFNNFASTLAKDTADHHKAIAEKIGTPKQK